LDSLTGIEKQQREKLEKSCSWYPPVCRKYMRIKIELIMLSDLTKGCVKNEANKLTG